MLIYTPYAGEHNCAEEHWLQGQQRQIARLYLRRLHGNNTLVSDCDYLIILSPTLKTKLKPLCRVTSLTIFSELLGYRTTKGVTIFTSTGVLVL